MRLIFEYIQFIAIGCVQREPLTTVRKVLKALTESVRRRTSLNRIYEVRHFLSICVIVILNDFFANKRLSIIVKCKATADVLFPSVRTDE